VPDHDIIGSADGDGDDLAFKIGHGLDIRLCGQRVKRGSHRKADDLDGQSRDARAQSGAGAEVIVDLPGLQRGRGHGRPHGDNFRIEAVSAVKASFSRCPRIEKAQRLRRDGDADFLAATLRGRGGLRRQEHSHYHPSESLHIPVSLCRNTTRDPSVSMRCGDLDGCKP
jgi:hypothetical protein